MAHPTYTSWSDKVREKYENAVHRAREEHGPYSAAYVVALARCARYLERRGLDAAANEYRQRLEVCMSRRGYEKPGSDTAFVLAGTRSGESVTADRMRRVRDRRIAKRGEAAPSAIRARLRHLEAAAHAGQVEQINPLLVAVYGALSDLISGLSIFEMRPRADGLSCRLVREVLETHLHVQRVIDEPGWPGLTSLLEQIDWAAPTSVVTDEGDTRTPLGEMAAPLLEGLAAHCYARPSLHRAILPLVELDLEVGACSDRLMLFWGLSELRAPNRAQADAPYLDDVQIHDTFTSLVEAYHWAGGCSRAHAADGQQGRLNPAELGHAMLMRAWLDVTIGGEAGDEQLAMCEHALANFELMPPRSGALLVAGHRLYADMLCEMGCDDEAERWTQKVEAWLGRPLAVALPDALLGECG